MFPDASAPCDFVTTLHGQSVLRSSGRLALACDPGSLNAFLLTLWEDFCVFLGVKEVALGSTFWLRCAESSPFQTTLMMDVVLLAFTPSTRSIESIVSTLVSFCTKLFSGFGQTKVVEDMFGHLRRREQKDTMNGAFAFSRIWKCAIGSGVLGHHGSQGVEPTFVGARHDAPLAHYFESKTHTPSVDMEQITGKATWPTFNAQTGLVLAAMRTVSQRCFAEDSWGQGSKTWKCSLMGQCSIVRRVKPVEEFRYYIVLGTVQSMAAIAWPAEAIDSRAGKLVVVGRVGPESLVWLTCFEYDEFEVLPSRVLSPVALYMALERKITPFMGIVLLATGDAISLLRHAATHCFWDLQMPTLKAVGASLGLAADDTDLMGVLEALVKHVLPGASDGEVRDILAKRGVAPCEDLGAIDVPHGVIEEICPDEDVEEVRRNLDTVRLTRERAEQWRSELGRRHPPVAAGRRKASRGGGRGRGCWQ
jgi:hypothetical protein